MQPPGLPPIGGVHCRPLSGREGRIGIGSGANSGSALLAPAKGRSGGEIHCTLPAKGRTGVASIAPSCQGEGPGGVRGVFSSRRWPHQGVGKRGAIHQLSSPPTRHPVAMRLHLDPGGPRHVGDIPGGGIPSMVGLVARISSLMCSSPGAAPGSPAPAPPGPMPSSGDRCPISTK